MPGHTSRLTARAGAPAAGRARGGGGGVREGRRTAGDAGPAAQDGAEQAHALVGRAADDVLDVVCAQAEVLRLWHDTWPAAQERSG